MTSLDNLQVQHLAPMYFGGWELVHRMTRSSAIANMQSIVFEEDQVVVSLNMDGCRDSMAVPGLGKDPSFVEDIGWYSNEIM